MNELHQASPDKFQDQLKTILENAEQIDFENGDEFVKEYHIQYAPNPLYRELGKAKEYPFNSLGDILQPIAELIHESVQAPDAICGSSVLAAATLAVQPFSDIEIDGRKFPVSNFFLTIGQSGERKSAVDNIVLKPHRDHVEEKIANYFKSSHSDGDQNPAFPLLLIQEPTYEGLIKSIKNN